jgi:zinc protease
MGRRAGLPEHLKAIKIDDLKKHWEAYYKPRNAILVLAGGFDADAVKRQITEQFGSIPPGKQPPPPAPREPPKFGQSREIAVKDAFGDDEATACVAFVPPQPSDKQYAPYLVLLARLMMRSIEPGPAEKRFTMFAPILDDPNVVAVSATAGANETGEKVFARLEGMIADTVKAPLDPNERSRAKAMFGLFLGLASPPDEMLAQNPYAVAFSLARREQLGIDAATLAKNFDSVTDADLRQVIDRVFSPKKQAGALIKPVK